MSTDLFYQTKESEQGNRRDRECSLIRALCNSSVSPSLLQRGLPSNHIGTNSFFFWSVSIEEIKAKIKSESEIQPTALPDIPIRSLHSKTNVLGCTGKIVVQPIMVLNEYEEVSNIPG